MRTSSRGDTRRGAGGGRRDLLMLMSGWVRGRGALVFLFPVMGLEVVTAVVAAGELAETEELWMGLVEAETGLDTWPLTFLDLARAAAMEILKGIGWMTFFSGSLRRRVRVL